MTDREQRGWIPATVGCHWSRNGYHISTITTGDGQRRGYVLMHNRVELASFVSWEEAERVADEHASRIRRAIEAIDADEPIIYDVAAESGQMVDNVKHMQWFVEAVADELED